MRQSSVSLTKEEAAAAAVPRARPRQVSAPQGPQGSLQAPQGPYHIPGGCGSSQLPTALFLLGHRQPFPLSKHGFLQGPVQMYALHRASLVRTPPAKAFLSELLSTAMQIP